jgi:hypothetical protein
MTKDLSRYADATPTDTMAAFADFLIVKVYGGTLPEGVDEASFRAGVNLGGSTRGYFQASDEWKSDPRNYLANVEANRAKKLAEARERAIASAKKSADRLAALEAKLADAVEAAKAKAEALAAETEDADADAGTADESADESASEVETPDETPEPRRSRRGPLSKTIESDADAA